MSEGSGAKGCNGARHEIRVLIADGHPIFRLGLERVLAAAPDIVVVGEAASGEEAMVQARAGDADVAVIDVPGPDRAGLATIRGLKASHPRVKVLLLTVHSEDRFAVPALRLGADGYLTKDASPGMVLQAVRRLAAGGKVLSAALAERLGADVAAGRDRPPEAALSRGEAAVMREIAAGRSTREIAARQHISVDAVRIHRLRVLRKMRLRNDADLTLYALRAGLVR